MNILPWFFENWRELARTALLALVAYAALIVLIRLAGKRTLAKMNVFDFVFVVALGSTLSATILQRDITLSHGLVATTTLILTQVAISWATLQSSRVEKLINGEPALLVFKGRFLDTPMKRERVTQEELRAA